MKAMKSMGLVVIGLVVGVMATGSLSARHGQSRSTSQGRLVISRVEPNGKTELVFIRDTKSSGCWLGVDVGQGVVSLAVAPTEACAFK